MVHSARYGAAVLSGLLAAGCADSEVEGEVDGEPFGDVASAIFMAAVTESSGIHEFQLFLTTYEDACDTYATYILNGASPAGEGPFFTLSLLFYRLEAVAAGEYQIQPSDETEDGGLEWVHATYSRYADQGWEALSSTGGSVTLDTVDTAEVEGSFTVNFEAGDSLEGYFKASLCDIEDF